MDIVNFGHLINGAVFSLMGIVIFGAGFWALDKFTPFSLAKELLDDQNTALGIVIGSVALGVSIIIAAAIH